MRPSVWQVAGMEEEVTAALEDDNVEEVQVLEIRFNQAVKEADERRGPEDYLHPAVDMPAGSTAVRRVYCIRYRMYIYYRNT